MINIFNIGYNELGFVYLCDSYSYEMDELETVGSFDIFSRDLMYETENNSI